MKSIIKKHFKAFDDSSLPNQDGLPISVENSSHPHEIITQNHPLNKKFKTINEAAKAKTDFLMETVFKDVDWSKGK
jgi:hypothetical protein